MNPFIFECGDVSHTVAYKTESPRFVAIVAKIVDVEVVSCLRLCGFACRLPC